MSVCDLNRERRNSEELVLVRAQALFGRHGTVLRDAGCPDVRLVWREAHEFSESREAEALSAAIWREQFTHQRGFDVTVEGEIRTVDGQTEIVVHRLVAYELSPRS